MTEIATDAPVARPVVVWSWPRRIAFRFGVVLAALMMLPFPFDALPKSEWLDKPYAAAWDWMTRAFADMIGVAVPPTLPTGSGDTTAVYVETLLWLVLAALGAALWSAIDRKRTAYPRVARVTFTSLRYWLAVVMFSYGFAKVYKTQFPTPSLIVLDHAVGEMSPMGLLWTFMGFSTPYTVFGGVMECLGAALLLWRRTTTLGALVLVGVLVNVVMLNFCYDVPVKLYSSTLLIVALVLAWPDARRLIAVLLGHPVARRPDGPRWSPRADRIRALIKVLFIGAVLIGNVLGAREQIAMLDRPVPALYGIYDVQSVVIDGVERPASATRWQRVVVDSYAVAVHVMTGDSVIYRNELDEKTHTLTLIRKDTKLAFTYTHPAPDQLELDGSVVFDAATANAQHVHIVLRARASNAFPLTTRGYHWVQEFPYNR